MPGTDPGFENPGGRHASGGGESRNEKRFRTGFEYSRCWMNLNRLPQPDELRCLHRTLRGPWSATVEITSIRRRDAKGFYICSLCFEIRSGLTVEPLLKGWKFLPRFTEVALSGPGGDYFFLMLTF